jgi:two-component system phosphate regulon sensor histidine kinase PhoR
MSSSATLSSLDPLNPDRRPGRTELQAEIGSLQAEVAHTNVGEELLRQLLAVSDELSGAITPADVVDVVTRSVVEVLHARAAEISLLEDDELVLIGAVGYDPEVAAALARMPLDSAWPLAEAVRTSEPVFVESLAQLRARYPRADKRLLKMTAGALACIPMALEGRTIGAFKVRFDGAHHFTDWEITFFSTLAHTAAQAIERARLWEDTQRLNETLRRVIAAERATAAELGAVIHAMGEPVVVCDREGRVRLANQAARTVLGVRRLDTYAAILARFDDPTGEAPTLGGTAPQGPVELRLRDTYRWLELTTYPVPAADDETSPWAESERPEPILEDSAASSILVIRDITALRQAQQLRDAFMGILSHELRTPITTIFGGTRVLARAGLSEETRREVSADISAEAERLHRLVEDLLVLARAEQDLLELSQEPILLQRVVESAIRVARSRTPDVPIIAAGASDPPTVSGDAVYVDQVVRNLVTAATRFGGPGVPVVTRLQEGDGEVGLEVLDRGPNLTPSELETSFALADNGGVRTSGVGIGLFVCRRLVEAMKGRVWVRAREDGGAAFGFALPRYEPD